MASSKQPLPKWRISNYQKVAQNHLGSEIAGGVALSCRNLLCSTAHFSTAILTILMWVNVRSKADSSVTWQKGRMSPTTQELRDPLSPLNIAVLKLRATREGMTAH